jgi:hypothetical protein
MNTRNKFPKNTLAVAITAAAVVCLTTANAKDLVLYKTHMFPDTIVLEPLTDQGLTLDVDLIVKGPEGFYLRKSFPAGALIEFNPASLAESALPDGTYVFETRIMGYSTGFVNRDEDTQIQPTTLLPNANGAFSIENGQIADPNAVEPANEQFSQGLTPASDSTQASDEEGALGVVVASDQIVQGSLCVGFDCVDGEVFGFDTIRMKENNTRIKFDDTSATAGFPFHDWQLTANDSASGGLNKFSIEDTTAASVPFTIEGAAPSNSLYVDDVGRIGIGTSTPVLQAHIVDGNTPALRMEQDGSSGFTAQTWDVAGNEANFFVRDVTSGSRLPFKIRPGAATDSLVVDAEGDVAIGIPNASAKLHVGGSGGTTSILVRETSGINAVRSMAVLENNGGSRLRFEDTSNDLHDWLVTANSIGFAISEDFSGVQEFMLQRGTGNLTIAGTLTQNSDRTRKSNITAVDPKEVLQKVVSLPISTWTYKEDPSATHLGPMAQDFYSMFELGNDERRIATIDTSGVALAAIQGLKLELDRKDEELKQLRAEIAALRETARRNASLHEQLESLAARLTTVEALQDAEAFNNGIRHVKLDHWGAGKP